MFSLGNIHLFQFFHYFLLTCPLSFFPFSQFQVPFISLLFYIFHPSFPNPFLFSFSFIYFFPFFPIFSFLFIFHNVLPPLLNPFSFSFFFNFPFFLIFSFLTPQRCTFEYLNWSNLCGPSLYCTANLQLLKRQTCMSLSHSYLFPPLPPPFPNPFSFSLLFYFFLIHFISCYPPFQIPFFFHFLFPFSDFLFPIPVISFHPLSNSLFLTLNSIDSNCVKQYSSISLYRQ